MNKGRFIYTLHLHSVENGDVKASW